MDIMCEFKHTHMMRLGRVETSVQCREKQDVKYESSGYAAPAETPLCREPPPHFFFVHIQVGFLQPFLQTGMQLHTGRYARLL